MARNPKASKGSTKQSDTEKSEETGTSESAGKEAAATAKPVEPIESKPDTKTESDDAPKELAGVDGGTAETEPATSDSGDIDAERSEGGEPDTDVVAGVIPARTDPSTEPPVPPTPPAPASRGTGGSGTFAMVIGGLIAGAIGFVIATFVVPEGWPNVPPVPGVEIDPALAEQSERIDALEADLAALAEVPAAVAEPAEPTDLGPLTEQVTSVETSLSEALVSLDSRLEDLETRIAALEARPEQSGPDGSAAMEAQMEAFRQQLDDVTAEAEARIAEAQERAGEIETAAADAAARAQKEAALSELKAALESGTAYSDTLGVFTAVPQPLREAADEGVPTLSALQANFADAARDALAATQTVPEDASAGQRFTAFLRRQTNARSLEPREGDDPDAVLSRAEAALSDGNLDTALTELSALPDDSREAMSDWISAAETRVEALRAVESLETSMN